MLFADEKKHEGMSSASARFSMLKHVLLHVGQARL
jgi:hypothetical protein